MARLSARPVSFVYAIGGETGLQKIGYSCDPWTRASGYRCADGSRFRVHHQEPVATAVAPVAERYAHCLLRRYAAPGEMFDVTPSMAVKAAQRAVTAISAGLGPPSKGLIRFFAPWLQPSENGNRTMMVRMPHYLLEAGRRAAEAEDRSISYLARKALERWLRDNGYLRDTIDRAA